MADVKKLKLTGYVLHDGQVKKDGDIIELPADKAERLVKLNKAEYTEEAGGKAIEEMTVAELDQLAEQVADEVDMTEYPKGANKAEKIEFLSEALADKAE